MGREESKGATRRERLYGGRGKDGAEFPMPAARLGALTSRDLPLPLNFHTKKLESVAKTEKIMRRKVALQQAADSSDDGDAFDEEDEEGGWGAAKRSYYADDGTADKKKRC